MALTNNAEGGVNGVTPTTTDTGSGDAFTSVVKGASSVLDYSNAHPAHGGMGYRMATRATAESNYVSWTNGSTVSTCYGRLYIYYDVAPTIGHSFLQCRSSAGVILGYLHISMSSGEKLQISDGSETAQWTGTTSISAGTQYRLEYAFVAGGATGSCQLKLYVADSNTVTEDSGIVTITPGSSTTAVDMIRIGSSINANTANAPTSTGYIFFDDLSAFNATWPGPVVSATYLRPISDITLGDWTPTPTSPTTLFDKLDETVASDAEYISGTTTVEIKFG